MFSNNIYDPYFLPERQYSVTTPWKQQNFLYCQNIEHATPLSKFEKNHASYFKNIEM